MALNINESGFFNVFMNVTNTVTHLVLGAVASGAIIFGIAFPGSYHLKNHIYLCVTGYVLMMAQSILIYSPHNGWSISLKYQDKKNAHLVTQIVGATLAITGSIIRIVNVNNFQSVHGVLGLIAMILTVMSLVGGIVGLWSKKTKSSTIIHSCVGSLALAAAFICLCLGFDKSMYRNTMGDAASILMISLTVAGFVGTIMFASISNFRRIFN